LIFNASLWPFAHEIPLREMISADASSPRRSFARATPVWAHDLAHDLVAHWLAARVDSGARGGLYYACRAPFWRDHLWWP
jgi:hypothetical protein